MRISCAMIPFEFFEVTTEILYFKKIHEEKGIYDW